MEVSGSKDFTGVHDAERVERGLDGTHQLQLHLGLVAREIRALQNQVILHKTLGFIDLMCRYGILSWRRRIRSTLSPSR